MTSIPVLYGYIQQLQQEKHSIGYDLSQLIFDTKNYTASISQDSYIVIILAIIIFWCCLGWVFDNLKQELEHNKTISHGVDPEEFDFLASSEAIPAKFNLVEAYIQMNDVESATKVLSEIIAHGNKLQRTQALSMLDDIS